MRGRTALPAIVIQACTAPALCPSRMHPSFAKKERKFFSCTQLDCMVPHIKKTDTQQLAAVHSRSCTPASYVALQTQTRQSKYT